jgi:hypothetical protein
MPLPDGKALWRPDYACKERRGKVKQRRIGGGKSKAVFDTGRRRVYHQSQSGGGWSRLSGA